MWADKRKHVMLEGGDAEGLCCGPGGVHGVLGGMIFGNRMDSTPAWRQEKADAALTAAGYDTANAPREARRGSDVALHGDVGNSGF
jgi:hypothetical protein